MDDIANLLKAIAALLWPVFAFAALLLFRPQLRDLLARIKKGKVLGQEIELAESLDRLDKAAVAAAAEVATLPPPPREENQPPKAVEDTAGPPAEDTEVIRGVLEEAARSPKAALILLASTLERELREVLASLGLLKGRKSLPFQLAFQTLNEWGGLPRTVTSSVEQFWQTRNRLVHGHDATNDDIMRAIDSGITIYKALRSIPRERNIVYHPGVDVYSDAQCSDRRPDVKGVILETESPGGATKHRRVYPSTRSHFQRGRRSVGVELRT